MTKDTGGPAFPQSNDRIVASLSIANSQGMTLRDYFAAKAMQAYTSDLDWRMDMSNEQTAIAAYSMADAMLKVRDQ